MLDRTRLDSDTIVAEGREAELLEVDTGQIEDLGTAPLGVAEDLRSTRWVIPVCRSWTKVSALLFVSPDTRFVAREEKAT